MTTKDRLLVVDDEVALRELLSRSFRNAGMEVSSAGTIAAAVDLFRRTTPDAVIIDFVLPDGTALDLMHKLRAIDEHIPIIILTGHASIDLAVQAMKEGADQFLTKPAEMSAVRVVVERTIANNRTRHQQLARASHVSRHRANPFIGSSDAIRLLAKQTEKIVKADCPVLILGETGCGKGVLARWIHENSNRSREAFVDVNCAGFSRELLETELFGHERGAFTGAINSKAGLFEVANRGTMFLDEIGDMDQQLQPKLLKVLEERRFRRVGDVKERCVDVRLITATHQDIEKRVSDARFRADLYFRINTVILRVPPLRHRRSDIHEMAKVILERIAIEIGRPGLCLDDCAADALVRYDWPGNVRELRNVLERAALLCDGNKIVTGDLHFQNHVTATALDTSSLTLEQVERMHIQHILSLEKGNVGRAAMRLGIPRSTLYHHLKSGFIRYRSFDIADA